MQDGGCNKIDRIIKEIKSYSWNANKKTMRSAMEIMVFLYVHVDAEEICHYMMHGLRREALLKKYSLWYIV